MSWIASTICSGSEASTRATLSEWRVSNGPTGGLRAARGLPKVDVDSYDLRPPLRARARLLRLCGVRLAPLALLRTRVVGRGHRLRDRGLPVPGRRPGRRDRVPSRRARL